MVQTPALVPALIPALVTPFSAENTVDYLSLKAMAQRLLTEGCDGLLINGTTGEAPTLNRDEKWANFEAVQPVCQQAGKHLMVGVGSNNTAASLEEAQLFAHAGADSLLVTTPYYNRPTQEGLLAHFSAICNAVAPTPVVLYNIPGRSVVQIEAPTLVTLAQTCPNLWGVKHCVPTLDKLSELRGALVSAGLHTKIHFWCGDDSLTLPMMALGAVGNISVSANVVAGPLKAMIAAFNAGQTAEALRLHQQLLPLMTGLFELPNPMLIKALLARRGECTPHLRLPMLAPSPTQSLNYVSPLESLVTAILQKEALIAR